METVIHQVHELGNSERSAAEQLVGHPLHDNQQLVIQVVTPSQNAGAHEAPSGQDQLSEWCNVYAGMSNDEIESLERAISQRVTGVNNSRRT